MFSPKIVSTILLLCFAITVKAALPAQNINSPTSMALNGKSGSGCQTKSFADWKSEKIRSAKEALNVSKIASGTEVNKDIAQLEFNLEVAEALSVTDYVVLYISNQPGQSKFREAASQLTPDETAKIMEAYLKALQSEQSQEKESARRSSAIDLLQ